MARRPERKIRRMQPVYFFAALLLGLATASWPISAPAKEVIRAEPGADLSAGKSDSGETQQACKTSRAARMLVNSIYSSCGAFTSSGPNPLPPDICNSTQAHTPRPLEEIYQARKSPPDGFEKKGCKDPCEGCSKPKYSSDPPEWKPPEEKPDKKQAAAGGKEEDEKNCIDPAPQGATDTTGLLSSICARAGQNLHPNSKFETFDPASIFTDIPAKDDKSTSAGAADKKDKNKTCFKPIQGGDILPGDIVIYSTKESKGKDGKVIPAEYKAFMIERVDPDKKNSCKFSIIEAVGSQKDDPKAASASANKKNSKQKSGSGVGVRVRSGDEGDQAISDDKGMMSFDAIHGALCGGGSGGGGKSAGNLRIIRHDSKKSGCMRKEPAKFCNEKCIDQCPNMGFDYENQ